MRGRGKLQKVKTVWGADESRLAGGWEGHELSVKEEIVEEEKMRCKCLQIACLFLVG